MTSPYKTKASSDRSAVAIILPAKDIPELWRGVYSLLESHQGLPIASTNRGALIRRLAAAIKEAC